MKCRQVKRFLTVRVFVEAVCESSALEAQHTVFHQLEMLLTDLDLFLVMTEDTLAASELFTGDLDLVFLAMLS